MKHIGTLKNNVEKTEKPDEAKKSIVEADMELSDEEMDQAAGGASFYGFSTMRHIR